MSRVAIQNRILSSISFPIFHFTTIFLPISISYPQHILSLVTVGYVEIPPLSQWGWVVRAALFILNIFSFCCIFRLLVRKGHRTFLFLVLWNLSDLDHFWFVRRSVEYCLPRYLVVFVPKETARIFSALEICEGIVVSYYLSRL